MVNHLLVERALALALKAHSGMIRDKDGVPYILHPMEVAVIAASLTRDEEVIAAALLHDTVEDAGISFEEITAACGPGVSALVASETEDKEWNLPPEQTWKKRKQQTLEVLGSTSDRNVKILWLSDKLANMRSFFRLWQKEGDAVWADLHESRASEQAWYYRTIETLLEDLRDTPAWQEYHGLVETVFGNVPR